MLLNSSHLTRCFASLVAPFDLLLYLVLFSSKARDTIAIVSIQNDNVKTCSVIHTALVFILEYSKTLGKQIHSKNEENCKSHNDAVRLRLIGKRRRDVHAVHTIENIWQRNQDGENCQRFNALVHAVISNCRIRIANTLHTLTLARQ